MSKQANGKRNGKAKGKEADPYTMAEKGLLRLIRGHLANMRRDGFEPTDEACVLILGVNHAEAQGGVTVGWIGASEFTAPASEKAQEAFNDEILRLARVKTGVPEPADLGGYL